MENKEIPEEVLKLATWAKVHKIKEPEQYGAEKYGVAQRFWTLIWPIGLIFGFKRSKNENPITKAQGISMIICSIIIGVLSILAVTVNSSSFDPNIEMIQGSYLDGFPNKTIGDAANEFFKGAKWSSGTSEGGTDFVNVEGDIMYFNTVVHAVLQFVILGDGSKFQVNAFEINGEPQPDLIRIAVISAMFE